MLFVPTNIPDTKLILEKMNEMGLGQGPHPVITNGGHMGAPEMLNVVGKDLMEGVHDHHRQLGPEGPGEADRDFKKQKEPWMTQDSISTYGDMWILKEAIEKAKSADRKKVAEAMRVMDTTDGPPSTSRAALKFEQNGRRAGAELVISSGRTASRSPSIRPTLRWRSRCGPRSNGNVWSKNSNPA